MRPLASVIIPTYNHGRFISQAIDSVLGQDFPKAELEIVVADDGSTDGTREIVGKYGPPIRYLRIPHGGKGAATAAAVEECRGRYLFNLDADDFFLPGKLGRSVSVFEREPGVVLVSHPPLLWDVRTDEKKPRALPPELTRGKMPGSEFLSFVFRRLAGRLLAGMGSTFAARSEAVRRAPVKRELSRRLDEHLFYFTVVQGEVFFFGEALCVSRIHHETGLTATSSTPEAIAEILRALDLILADVSAGGFSDEVKAFYGLKVRIQGLILKERLGRKAVSDLLGVWAYLAKNSLLFWPDWLYTLRDYSVLSQSLPVPARRALRRLKGARAL